MDRIKRSALFRSISVVLIITFIALDISYAYPPETTSAHSTLAVASRLQDQAFFSTYSILESLNDIGEGVFGRQETGEEPVRLKYLNDSEYIRLSERLSPFGIKIVKIVPVDYFKNTPGKAEELKAALDEIGYKGRTYPDGVAFILFEIHGKKLLVQIAEKEKVSPEMLPGYTWVVSDKYVVKRVPEDYREGDAPAGVPSSVIAIPPITGQMAGEAILPLGAVKEGPKITISEPLPLTDVPVTAAAGSTTAPRKVPTLRVIIVSLALTVLTVVSAFAGEAGAVAFTAGSIFSAVKDLAFTHPITARVVALGIGIAAFFAVWRVFFPVSWHSIRLKSTDFTVRHSAVTALGETGDPRAVKPLIKALGDSYSLIRSSAAIALGKIKDPRTVEPLIRALEDSNFHVRFAAREALGMIGWKPLTQEDGTAHVKVQEHAVDVPLRDALPQAGDATKTLEAWVAPKGPSLEASVAQNKSPAVASKKFHFSAKLLIIPAIAITASCLFGGLYVDLFPSASASVSASVSASASAVSSHASFWKALCATTIIGGIALGGGSYMTQTAKGDPVSWKKIRRWGWSEPFY